MRRYLDTSLIVAALVREAGTEAAKAYLTAARTEAGSGLDMTVFTRVRWSVNKWDLQFSSRLIFSSVKP